MTADPDDPDVAESDRVLLLAMRAWAPSPRVASGPAEDPRARLFARLDPSWSLRLKQADDPDPADRPEARRRLREAHRAEARVDLDRVHPSWWERALREESPAVRRAVVASAPDSIRGEVQSTLLLDNDDIRPDRPPDAETLSWACSLWTERLVGGEPDRPDDPPVIAAMSSLSLRASYRLCRDAGLLKLALTGESGPEWAADFAASAGPEFALIARHDLKSTPPDRSPRRRLPARLGLLTIARLLSIAEPFNVRWALQHWPYAIARQIRPLMPPPSKRSPVMMQVESTPPDRSPRRRLPARLGLLTIARLLSIAEPFRVRWALQHWPYAIARQIRPLMPPPSKRSPVMMQVESTLFRTARDRLPG